MTRRATIARGDRLWTAHAATVAVVQENLDREGMMPLARDVSRRHRVGIEAVLGRTRTPRDARARHELWWLLYGTLGLSAPELGALVDRDHTSILTVIHAAERQQRRLLRESGVTL